MIAVLLCGTGNGISGDQNTKNDSLVREECTIVVDSTTEHWRLEWRTPPQPACDPTDDDWITCPCSGFAFGEKGKLDLVRTLPGGREERLHLDPLFRELTGDTLAILPKWPEREEDLDRKDSVGFAELVQHRSIVRIMNFADYDHDGRATEFMLQIGAFPCGHRQTVLVGISREIPHLHVFGSAAHPDRPIILEDPSQWVDFLKSRGDTTLTLWLCGDHGNDEQLDIELHSTNKGIDAFHLYYTCEPKSTDRKLIRREEL